MEKYKKSLIHSAIRTSLLCILLIVIYLLLQFSALAGFLPQIPEGDTKNSVSFFRLGLVSGFVAVVAFYIIRTVNAIHKPEKLQKMYIRDNDERERLIKQKTGLSTCIITMFCLVFTVMIAASYNLLICETLVAVIYGMIFIFAGSNLYYRHKY